MILHWVEVIINRKNIEHIFLHAMLKQESAPVNFQSLKLPHKWLKCPRKSKLIADKIIVHKTILDDRYDSQISEENRFNWKMLSESVRSTYNRNIGLVIDLTYTDRFYDKKELERDGCRCVKIACKGYEERPSLEAVNEFIQVIQNFMHDFPQKMICVHCTHGFNRSGFMIISFLCTVMKFDVQTSANMFASVRPPGIYKEDYLADLSLRYGDGTHVFVTPQLPDWCKDDESVARRPKREIHFMNGMIPNVDYLNDLQTVRQVQSYISNASGWKDRRIPNSHHLRHLMLIRGKNEIFTIDRYFNVYSVNNMTFPRRKTLDEHIAETLLDGEMVIDPGSRRGRFLVHDIITFEGREMFTTSIHNRNSCIVREIIDPRNIQFQKGLLDKVKEPFSISDITSWKMANVLKFHEGNFLKRSLTKRDCLDETGLLPLHKKPRHIH